LLKDHPKNIYIPERAVLARVDAWLGETLNDPSWIASGQEADRAEEARCELLREQLANVNRKISNLVDAIENADGSSDILTKKLAERSVERDRIQAELDRLTRRIELAEEDIRDLIEYVGGIAAALNAADRADKGLLYKELGLRLTYLPAANQLRAELGTGVSLSGRVRGGT
jgi:hypothetical protein